MAITITIQGTPIEIPSSGESPNWSSGIIEAFQVIESALNSAVGTFDVPPQVFNGDAYNPGTGISLPNLSFSTSDVRSADISYAVYRETSSTNAAESGSINVVYNPNNSVGNKWEIQRDYVGDGQITFTISDAGQVSFTTTTLAGINHTMRISYSAKALEQN